MKGDKMAKRSSFGSIVRKRFSDITNLQPQPKFSRQEENPPQVSPSTKDYIDKLIKENLALVKLIEDRNKIIELSGIELRKLRINFQRVQLQNWNLAQSNSQMSAELNLGREKLKSLQHELVCKDALLKAKNLELQGKENMDCQKAHSKDGEEAVEEPSHKANNDNKPRNHNRRRPTRSQSMGPATTFQQAAKKEMIENKRRCLRRQSARFKSQQREPTDNLFEIEDVKFSVSQSLDIPMDEDDPTPMGSLIREEDKDQKLASRFEAQESKRSSIGRPSRRAAEKVHSYKEVPLNLKMRRSE